MVYHTILYQRTDLFGNLTQWRGNSLVHTSVRLRGGARAAAEGGPSNVRRATAGRRGRGARRSGM